MHGEKSGENCIDHLVPCVKGVLVCVTLPGLLCLPLLKEAEDASSCEQGRHKGSAGK